MPPLTYYSQYKQDRILNEFIFHSDRTGAFLDIGAYDGVLFSNSCFFERDLGWKGLCIEPTPHIFKELKKNRNCICVEGCIAAQEGHREFTVAEGVEVLGGLADRMAPDHRQRLLKETAEAGGRAYNIKVPCYNVNRLCTSHGMSHINLCSLDTEGSELEILQSIDFAALRIDVLTVENTHHGQTLRDFMTAQGYHLAGRLTIDDVFIRRDMLAAFAV